MSDFSNVISRTKVTPDILEKVLVALGMMEPEDRRHFKDRAFTIMRVVNEQGLGGNEPVDLASAIMFRLEALARLAKRAELKAWSIPGDVEGMVYIDPAVVEATAAQPLMEDGNKIVFDAESFFKRLLYLSGEEGRG